MTGKQVCPKHKWAHAIGTECHWCVPEPVEEALPVPSFYGKDNSLDFFDIFPFGHVSYIEISSSGAGTAFADSVLECIADNKAVAQFSIQTPVHVQPIFVCSRTRTPPYQGILDIKLGTYSAFLAYASLNPSVFVNSFVVFDSDVSLDITPTRTDVMNFHSNFLFLSTKVDPLDWLEASMILSLSSNTNFWNFTIRKSIDPGLTDFMIDRTKV